jgi:hypothetical protein
MDKAHSRDDHNGQEHNLAEHKKTIHANAEHANHNISNKDSKYNNSELKNPLKDKSLIYTIAIIIIILAIFAGIYIYSNIKKAQTAQPDVSTQYYNNYTFLKFEDNKWYTNIMIRNYPYTIPFYYNPNELEGILIDNNAVSKVRDFRMNHSSAYIALDPNESSIQVIAGVEIARILGNKYNIFNFDLKTSFTKDPGIYSDYPIITCDNASNDVMVFLMLVGKENKVYSEDNCIIIESLNITETIRVADAFSYKLLGIMP